MEVATQLAWTGAAINLATEPPTPQDLKVAVETVLTDGRFRHRARELQAP